MKGFDKASMVRRNKLINNLHKYDVGTTPINSGYQRAMNSIPVPFVSLLGLDLSLMVSGQKDANVALYLNSGTKLATLALGAVNISKEIAKGAITKGTGAVLSVAGAIPSAIDMVGAINKKGEFNGLGGNELDSVASKNTEYRNGVAYQTVGGVDNDSIMRAASARDTGENVGLTTSAVGLGAGIGGAIGSIVPVIGPLLGTGLGALVGGIGSLFGWSSDEEKEQRRLIENSRIASNAANMLNEATAASLGLRNEFYATHADQGLSPAYLSGGETKVNTDGEGNVTGFEYFPVTPATPMHADNILTSVGENDGVFGRIKNKRTGRMYMTDASKIVHDPTLPKLDKNNLLTLLLWEQDVDLKGKNSNMKIGRFDRGRYMGLLSMLPGIIEMGVGAKLSHSYAKDPVVAFNPYTINNNAAAAANELASLHYNPYPMLNSLRETDRQAIYNMNTASLSPAQRMAMLSTYYNNKMRNKADILASGLQLENQYRAAHANLIAKLGEEDAARRQQGNAVYADSFAKARAARRKGIETGWQTGLKGINTAVGNYLNNYWTDRNIGLYEQAYKTAPVDILAMNKEMSSAFKMPILKKNTPLPFTTPVKYNIPTKAERDELYKLILGV